MTGLCRQITSADSKDLGEATVLTVGTERRIGTILDDTQARLFIELNHPDLPTIDTPHVLLHLVEQKIMDMHAAWDALCRMRDVGGFSHRFANRPKTHWMGRRDYPVLVRL